MSKSKMTLQKASQYSGRSVSWIRKKILDNELKATKESFKYGERWLVTQEELDRMEEQAKVDKNIVEVREVNKPVPVDELLDQLTARITESIQGQNEELADSITQSIDKQFDALNSRQDRDHEEIERQREEINRLQQQLKKEKNKNFFDRLKEIFY